MDSINLDVDAVRDALPTDEDPSRRDVAQGTNRTVVRARAQAAEGRRAGGEEADDGRTELNRQAAALQAEMAERARRGG